MSEEAASLGYGIVIGKTDSALFVNLSDLGAKWIPFSAIVYDSELQETSEPGEQGIVLVEEEWAEGEDLI